MENFFKKTQGRCFGTFNLKGEQLALSFKHALETGYNFFDTAQWYENEFDLGEAIKKTGINRSDIMITTKVHPDNYKEELFINSVHKSLKDLKTDYVDVLLLHWPDKSGDNSLSLDLLQKTHDQGLAKYIGVSNYNIAMLNEAINKLTVKPITNQIEFHPLIDQSKILNFAKSKNIDLFAYCSIARGKILEISTLNNIAIRHKISIPQVAQHWAYQKGVIVNSMSTKPNNINDNFNILNFELSTEEMDQISNLNSENYRIVTREKMDDKDPPMGNCVPDWD